jgi:hypothetical protein
LKFPYAAYEVDPVAFEGRLLYRPVIRVRLTGPLGASDFWALLDTGADETYVTREMADLLGVVPIEHALGTVHSASGTMTVLYGELGIELDDGIENCSWKSIVGIVEQDWPEAILGHRGVLEFFDAMFLGAEKSVVLSSNSQGLDVSRE